MAKKRHKNKKKQLDPDTMLSGKASFTAYDLVQMIHQVNPTNKEIRGKEKSGYYKIKNRLQSLLIRDFRDSLIIEQSNPENPLLIGIKLKHYDDDACHVYMNELEEDARSWCQSQIDEAIVNRMSCDTTSAKKSLKKKDAKSTRPDSEQLQDIAGLSENELMQLSKNALDEYDYTACENYCRRALEISLGGIEPVLLLLELFIDYLATYNKAILLAESLSPNIKKDKRIKAFLALAAARSGNINLALEQIGSSTLPQSFEVRLIALKYFITQEDVASGKRQLSALKAFERDDLNTTINKYENDIEIIEAKKLEPQETMILQTWEKSQFKEAVMLADKLLSEHPRNKIARKICDKYDKQTRMKKIKQLLQEADGAKQKNDFIKELELLKKAIAAGANAENLRQRLNDSQKRAILQKDEIEISRIISRFRCGNRDEALLIFSNLSPEKRLSTMNRIDDPHFIWVDQGISSHSRLKPERIVKAVLTFGKSKEAFQKKADPQLILSELNHYVQELQSIPAACEFLNHVEKMLLISENDKIETLLLEIDSLLDNDDLTSARELLNQLKFNRLNVEYKMFYEDLDIRLCKFERIKTLNLRYTENYNQKNYFPCKEIARELADITNDAMSANWFEKITEISALIKKKLRFTIINIDKMPPYYGCSGLNWTMDYSNGCLLPDYQQVVIVNSNQHWIFLVFYSLSEEKFTNGIILHTPSPILRPIVTNSNNTLWITGENGCIIELSLESLDVLNWYDFQELGKNLADDRTIVKAMLFPKSRYLFLNSYPCDKLEEETCEFININENRIVRSIKSPGYPLIFNNGETYSIAISNRTSDHVHIYSENGRLIKDISVKNGQNISSVSTHPNGGGLIFLTHYIENLFDPFRNKSPDDSQQETDELCLSLDAESNSDKICKPVKLEDSNYELHHSMFTSLASALIFVCFFDGCEFKLAAFKSSEDGFIQLYQIKIPDHFAFVSDENTNHLACITFQNNKINVIILDEQEPSFASPGKPIGLHSELPDFLKLIFCTNPTNAINAHALAIMAQIKNSTYEHYQQLIHNFKHGKDKTAEDLAALIYALQRLYSSNDAEDVKKWLHKRYPDHFRVLFDLACRAAEERHWSEVISLLGNVSRKGIDDGTACHICHILGISYFAEGKIEKARSLWEEGIEYEKGECDLMPLIHYANISLMPENMRTKCADPINITLTFYESVDNHITAEEWLKAIKLIETSDIVLTSDLQILARLTEAYLQLETDDEDMRWFCKVYALSNFCKNQNKIHFSNEQILPPFIETWPENRFLEIKNRAEKWLADISDI